MTQAKYMTFFERFRPFKRHYGKVQLCKNKEKEEQEEQEEWSSTEHEVLSQVSTNRALAYEA